MRERKSIHVCSYDIESNWIIRKWSIYLSDIQTVWRSNHRLNGVRVKAYSLTAAVEADYYLISDEYV